MSDSTSFRKIKPALMAIPVEAIRPPDMPVPHAILEATEMHVVAKQDAPALITAGLEEKLLDELGYCIDAMRYAQAIHIAGLNELRMNTQHWRELQVIAKGLRQELLTSIAFATRLIPDAVAAIRTIRENHSQSQLVHDLMALVQLGRLHSDRLQAIHFDMKILEEAHATAESVFVAYARAKIEPNTTISTEMRDRAYTHMRKVMSQIRLVAEFVLRKNRSRLRFYHSAYHQSRSLRAKSRKSAAKSVLPFISKPKTESQAVAAA